MTSEIRLIYVNVRTFDDSGAVVRDEHGERAIVCGPGHFDMIEDGRFCCLALVLNEETPRFLVQFRSGEKIWIRDEKARFYDHKTDALAC